MLFIVTRGLLISSLFLLFSLTPSLATAASRKADVQRPGRSSTSKCTTCSELKVVRKSQPCHPKGHVDGRISKNYKAAMRDMRRAGITPKVTNTWRSSARQASLHRCSNSRVCRRNNPGLYYAMPAGASAHEAGLAVDISGVATGPRGAKRLTPKGRKIVHIMQKNGFSWRYGLKDPVHFEVPPRRAGYKNLKQAIRKSQTTCSVRLARRKK